MYMLAFMALQDALSDSLMCVYILDIWAACSSADAKYACFVF